MSITLDRGGTSVTLTDDLAVRRSVGRPNAELRKISTEDVPKYIDKNRSASDVFEISGEFTTGTPEADAKTLVEDIIRPPLGYGSLTLTFVNSLYELGSFDVAPIGSRSARVSYSAGETGIVRMDTLSLRVIQQPDDIGGL